MIVVNMEAIFYLQRTPENILAMSERDKKREHIDSCLQQCYHFLLFIISINSLLGTDSEATLNLLAIRLITKWQQP